MEALGRPEGLLLGTVLVLMAAPVTSPIRDPDFWWHLRTGQLIVDHRGLLGTDPFTYTVSTHTWVMHEWLTEVLFAGLHALGGVGLIVLVLSIATWLGLFCILLRARNTGAHPYAVAAGLLLAVITGYPIWGPRAQMETFALSCLTIWLWDRHMRRGGRAVWALVPVMLVWSNLHSGFIIGLGFMVLMLLAEYAERHLHPEQAASPERLRELWKVLAACVLIAMLNPNGPGIYLYAAQTQSSPAQQALIQEWHSPDFHDGLVRVFEGMLLSLVLLLVINRRARLRDLALALATAVMAFQSTRHIALFIAAATPLYCEQLSLATPVLLRWALRVLRGRDTAPPPARAHPPSRPFAVMTLAVLVLIAASVPGLRLLVSMRTPEDDLSYAQDYPVCAARWLLQAPGGLNVFNQYGEGGYLTYALSAHGDRVFIFGDAALMGDDLLLRYGSVEGLQPQWYDVITNAGGTPTDAVIFDINTPLANLLDASPRLQRVYGDRHNGVWVPTSRPQVLHELQSLKPLDTTRSDTCSQLARTAS